MEVAKITKKRMETSFKEGKRFDGRALLDYRPITLKRGVAKKAEGSAEVTMGKTKVLAGVKLSMGVPYPNSEDEGTMMTTVELLPLSSGRFKHGPPQIEAIELARIVDRGIRESGILDFKKLCITVGEEVWTVMIDLYPLNDDGNLIDAAALAAVAALQDAVFPELKDGKIEYGTKSKNKLPLAKIAPLTMTFYKLGQNIILDPTAEEVEASDGRISIAVSEDKKDVLINAMQKGGYKDSSEPFSKEELFEIFDQAEKKQKELRKILEKSK